VLVVISEDVNISSSGSIECDCTGVHEQFAKLNFVNHYANEMQEGVFYQRVEPRKTLSNKKLIYYSEEVASLLDLELESYLVNTHCTDEVLAYLSFEELIPGSQPISIPHSEYRYLKREGTGSVTTASLLPERNGGGVLLGTIQNKAGDHFDLFAKGVGNVPFTGLSDGFLDLTRGSFEVIIGETIHGMGTKTVRNLAVMGSQDVMQEGSGRDSNIIILQVAPTFIRMGTIEYFLNQKRIAEVNQILTFIRDHFYPTVPLSDNHFSNCQEDDDDDEEDDDEYCYRSGTNDLLLEMSKRFFGNILELGYKAFQSGIISSGTFGVDGTMLEFQLSRFKERGDVPLMKCGSEDERDGGVYTIDKYKVIRGAIYQHMAVNLGLPKTLIKKINRGCRAEYQEKDEITLNKRIGIISSTKDAFAEMKSYEIQKALSGEVDWMSFLREIGHLQPFSTTTDRNEISMDETFWKSIQTKSKKRITVWTRWAKKFREELRKQALDPADRQIYVENFHPAFLPRTYVISSAIKEIENGNFTMFKQIIEHAHNPYDPNFPEEWNQIDKPVYVFPCTNEDKVVDAGTIQRVTLKNT